MSRRQPHPSVQKHRGGLQDEQQVKNRVLVGQVATVDEINGQVVVTIPQAQEQFKLAIPLYGFSIKGLKSSWIRYMPQSGDFVKVEFEPDNTPTIIGYATFGEEFSGSGERQGSIAAPRQSAYATTRRLADDNVNGLGTIFRRLKQGEWDMRSSGGAEIYGTKNGTLTLAGGGGADIRLVKERQELKSRARVHIYEDDGVEVRWGEVRRVLLPTDSNESAVTANPTGAVTPREHKVRIASKSPPLGVPELLLYEHIYGDVRDGGGLPELLGATPLRSRSTWANAAGLTTLEVKVDAFGNIEVQQAAFAVQSGVAINGGGVAGARVTSLATDFLNTDINSTVNGTMDSLLVSAVKGGVQVYLDAPLVNLGSQTAIQPVIKGLQFSTSAVAPYVLAEGTFMALLATALTALVPAFAAAGVTPITNPAEIAAFTAAAAGIAPYIAAIPVFGTATASSLSRTVLTD